jgi:cobalt-zinc-cadmium efflux system outer membrane protein
MKTLLWPLGLAALLSSPFVATAQPSATEQPLFTLEAAQDLAASRSPTIAAAKHEVDATLGGIQQAGAWRNPELGATVEDTRSATRTTTATIGFPLELGGKRPARISAAERAHDVASAQLAEVRAKVRAQVVLSYFAVVIAQERLKLASDSERLSARVAKVVGKRVEAGKVSPVDATRAKVDVANAKLEFQDAQGELQSTRQALGALWGDPSPRFGDVEENLAEAPVRPSADELMRQVDASPALEVSRLMVDSRQALIAVERSKAAPDVVVTVGAKRDNTLGLTQAVVGVSIPLPLFDRNQGAVREAAKRADKAQDEYDANRVQLVADLSQASTRLATTRASIAVLRETVLPAAQQAYDASTTGFEAGKFGFLDVIDTQRSLLQARARYLNTLATAYQAATTIDRLLGR